jgi:hypothetical protein
MLDAGMDKLLDTLTNKEPLNGEGTTVGPSIIPASETLDHSVCQELADDNGKVDATSDDTAKDDRSHFRAVQGTDGQVKAETNTEDQLADEEAGSRKREDLAKNTAGDKGQPDEKGPPTADAVGYP